MSNALAIADLTVEYVSGGYVVRPIDELNASVQAGELVLLLGASGCGKTTLLSAIAGILQPTSGTIRVGDVEVTGLRGPALNEYRRRTVGIVFQAFNLVPSLTALENVEVAMRLAGRPARTSRDRAAGLLHTVGLTDRAGHRPGDLSGGQQQRVAIARALGNDPTVLLADEPTAHLDYIQVEGVLRLLREVADQGRIVVVSTHDERMIPLADRVIAMTPMSPTDSRPPREIRLSEGEVLFRQGDVGDLIYVVRDGRIDIVRSCADGGEELLTTVRPGAYFGELAPLFGLRRAASARAATAARVTGYSTRDFRELVNTGPTADLLRQAAESPAATRRSTAS